MSHLLSTINADAAERIENPAMPSLAESGETAQTPFAAAAQAGVDNAI